MNNQSFLKALYDTTWPKVETDGGTSVLLVNNAARVGSSALSATPYTRALMVIMMTHNDRVDGNPVAQPSIIKAIEENGSITAFDNGPDSDDIVHRKVDWSSRARRWVKHTKGESPRMAIGIPGQCIHLDPTHKSTIIKLASQGKSKDDYLNKYDLKAFAAIVNCRKKK